MPLGPSLSPARGFPHFNTQVFPTINPVVVNAAANLTYTPAQVLSGMILRDPAGAGRTDTLPSAADLNFALDGCAVGTVIEFYVRNDGGATVLVQPGVGGGGAVTGSGSVVTLNGKLFWIRFTNVTLGSEAYIVHSLGSFVF
jgi:hypothetical protein